MPTTRRRRTTTTSSPTSPPETQPQAPAEPPWLEHPTLSGLRDRLQLVYDCWTLLELPDGTSRRPVYLPRGIEEPETCYLKRLEAARPTGFYRDALRTYAGMLSRLAWQELPDSLTRVATDVDGQGTDLGVFLFLADLLTLRDGGCLILQLPPQHRWPSEGDRLEALAKGDRLSLPRLQLVPRGDLLNWRLPTDSASRRPASGPVEIVWREPRRQALPPRFASGNAAVPTVVLDAHGGLVPDPQAWLYRSLSVTDDGLVLRSWQANPNPGAADGYDVVPVGEPERMPQRFDLPALWYSVDGTAFGEGDLPHLGLAHQYLNHYRCRSEYEDLLSRTALPVGVRTGLVDAYGFRRSDGALARCRHRRRRRPAPPAAGALHLLLHGPARGRQVPVGRDRGPFAGGAPGLPAAAGGSDAPRCPDPRRRPRPGPHRAGDFAHRRPELCGAAVAGGPEELDAQHPAAPVDPPHRRKALGAPGLQRGDLPPGAAPAAAQTPALGAGVAGAA